MTIEHYVEELHQVVHQLNLTDYYLYGHSWGTMLATDFYLAHPEGIKAMILSGPALSIPRWITDTDSLIAMLPDSVQLAIRTSEANKTYTDSAYQAGVTTFYKQFVARTDPWPADMDSTFAQMGQNIYMYMGGPSEFTIVGELKNYDRTGSLGNIKVPTLLLGGEFDEARPATVHYYSSLIPGSKAIIIPASGHLITIDQPEANVKAIAQFLNELEEK